MAISNQSQNQVNASRGTTSNQRATNNNSNNGNNPNEANEANAAPAWRQFSFYDANPVRDSQDFSKPPLALRSVNEVAAVVSCPIQPLINPDPVVVTDASNSTSQLGGANDATAPTASKKTSTSHLSKPSILVGDISGRITVLEPERYSELASWSAYPLSSSSPTSSIGGRITHVTSDSRGRIVTLGEEDNVKFPILRIWDMRINGSNNRSNGDWSPRLLSEGKVQHGSRPHPVAALAHTPSLSYLSVGLADGTVLLLRGLDSALMSAPSSSTSSTIPAVSLPKFKVVFEPPTSSTSSNQVPHEPVTALGFSEVSPPNQRTSTEVTRTSKSNRTSNPRKTGGRNITNVKDAIQPPIKPSSTTPASVHLFIVTLSRILRYTVHGKGAGSAPTVVDDVGCALGCAAVVPSFSSLATSTSLPGDTTGPPSQGALAGKMVVAREEAIYVVGAEGREACFAFEGSKSSVRLSSSHLVIVSPPIAATAASTSATVRNFVADRDRGQRNLGGAGDLSASGSGASSPARGGAISSSPSNHPAFMSNGNARRMQNQQGRVSEIAKVSIFDLDNKLVAYSGAFERGVRDAWVGPSGEVCVLGDDGALMRLDEKPLPQQLSLLFRRSLFLLAVNLAKSHATRVGTPEAAARVETLLGDIFRRYGDHLYGKGDFEGAMTQFIKTIGFTPPSYVIRKFLDAQRINNLTSYLHELHARGLANSDHTTLLLNCYTKLKDVASLNRFIKRPLTLSSDEDKEEDLLDPLLDEDDYAHGGKSARDELPFDLETAMRVCRQAGYYSHAAYLARRYDEHDEYMRIQIEDAKDFSDALLYLRSLSPEEAEANLLRYGKTLLNELPDQTTDLLIELCSGNFKPTSIGSMNLNGEGKNSKTQDSTQGKSAAAAFLASLQVGGYSNKNGNDSSRTSAVVEPYSIDGRRGSVPALNSSSTNQQSEEEKSKTPVIQESSYLTPSPTIFFPHFIRHRPQFVRFLSTIAEIKWGQRIESQEDYHKITSTRNGNQRTSRNGNNDLENGVETEEDEAERVLRELGLTSSNSYSQDEDDDPERRDQRSVWNTLLELYLRTSNLGSTSSNSKSNANSDKRISMADPNSNGTLELSRKGQRERALKLLEQHDNLPFDQTHALVLCSMEKFTEGIVLLYEQMGMFEEILRFWMDSSLDELSGESSSNKNNSSSSSNQVNGSHNTNSSCKVMEALKLYGKENPHLYPITLRYLVSEDRILSRHQDDLKSVLNHIEDEGLMSPLEVVQALSRTGVANVGLVRDYLTRAIEAEREEIDGDRRLIASYRTETAKKQKEVSDLTSPDTPRVFQINRCTSCGGQLDLPSVHFMCKHSFHQRCLGENEVECPECARSYGVIREIRRGNEQLGDRQDLFLQEVSEGGFDAVTAMFSKGLLSNRP